VQAIRLRACVAVIQDGQLLLVPHYGTDAGPVQWHLPGGAVAPGESVREAAAREAREETGLDVLATELLDVSEVIDPQRAWHSVTIAFQGVVRSGALAPEPGHLLGDKPPRWFTRSALTVVPHHPPTVIGKLLDRLIP
jgi:ADP-ribose pyrophosphatase YjhB (NUDIX family)